MSDRSPRAWHVRRATEHDALGIAEVHLQSTADAYAPLAADWPVVDRSTRAAKWQRWLAAGDLVWVAAIDDRIVAFASGGPARRSDLDAEVEVYVMHVVPGERGRGIGSALWDRLCGALRAPELRAMIVATLAELRVNAFYRARGGTVVERAPEDFFGAPRIGVTYRWPAGVHHDEPREPTGGAQGSVPAS